MRNRLFFLILYFIFWIFFSCLARGLFLIFQNLEFEGGRELLKVFAYGLRMDASLSGYVVMLSSVFMVFFILTCRKWARVFFAVFTFVLIAVFSLIIVSDLELFKAWGYHMNSSVFEYLKTPKEAMASVSSIRLAGLVGLIGGLTFTGFYLYRRSIAPFLSVSRFSPVHWYEVPFFLIFGGVMLLPIRGGFDVAPMNVDFVYFSRNSHANQAAINPVWNFLYEAVHHSKRIRKYRFMEDGEAVAVTDSLYGRKGDFDFLISQSRPNIVLLLLESFTADAVGVLGGEAITPNLDMLAKEGVLFRNIYATGNRSDRGIAGVISGFPSFPSASVLSRRQLLPYLPYLPLDLEKKGYKTAFYYAGDLNFAGFRSYTGQGFRSLVTQDDFSGESLKHKFKWGIHDEFMFERLFEDIKIAESPFFYMAFNMSSHEPFDVPGKVRIEGGDTKHRFMNSVAYTDACLGEFTDKLKASGIWENTLLVLVADHGVRYMGNQSPDDASMYHIPLIFSGGAVKEKGRVIETYGSQTDVAETLLQQLQIEGEDYPYGRNLLARSEDSAFAFFCYANGVGMIRPGREVYFYYPDTDKYKPENTPASIKRYLKAYLQSIDIRLNIKP